MFPPLALCVEMPPPKTLEPRTLHQRLWQPGMLLRVRFLDGDPALQARVAEVARTWSDYANITFVFDDTHDAPIRITFAGEGLWAHIGTDALAVPVDRPTLGLGQLTAASDDDLLRSVVLHSFGHVLGFTHAMLHLDDGIPWDIQQLHDYYRRTYGWSEQQVAACMLALSSVNSPLNAALDLASIMLMAIPHELTHGGFAIAWNHELSEADRVFVSRCYPGIMPYIAIDEAAGGISMNLLEEQSASDDDGRGLTSPDGAKTLREERIRLDAATPAEVFADVPFDVAVAVVQLDAPLLEVEDLPLVASRTGKIYRPEDEEVIDYIIKVEGRNCDVTPEEEKIQLHRGENLEPIYFSVTAHDLGRQAIIVKAYQADRVVAAQTRVRLEVQVPVLQQPISTTPENEVTRPMDIVLTPAEVRQFKEALLSAFQRSDLEQVVYFGLEVRLADIISPSNFDKEATDLVMWANANNKVALLLAEARKENPGNLLLRQFAEQIEKRLVPPLVTPPTDPYKGRKAELIQLLSNLPISASFIRRTQLLDGIPGADGIERDENNKVADLNMMLADLARRGRLASGELPVVKLIDNALADGEGYEVIAKLRALREELAQT